VSGVVRKIRKCLHRRLHDVAENGYITLADAKQMVLEDIDPQVVGAKTSENLARANHLQVILAGELGQAVMISSPMPARRIRFLCRRPMSL
jgi:polyhydroxyalkanoate synthesis regulator protein